MQRIGHGTLENIALKIQDVCLVLYEVRHLFIYFFVEANLYRIHTVLGFILDVRVRKNHSLILRVFAFLGGTGGT